MLGVRRAAVAVVVLVLSGLLHAASSPTAGGADQVLAVYDFTNDAVGSVPAGTSVAKGRFAVVEDVLLGRSLRATATDGAGIASIEFRRVLGSDMDVTWRETTLPLQSSRHGFFLRSVGGSGYLFQVNVVGTDPTKGALAIFKLVDGQPTKQLGGKAVMLGVDRSFRATAIGDQLTFSTSDDGTTFTPALTARDTDTPIEAGGLTFVAGLTRTAATATTLDNIRALHTPASGALLLTRPMTNQIRQRTAANTGSIEITGGYLGSPTAIEARWGDGAWQVVDAAPRDGAFRGVLANLPAGQRRLEVRFANQTTVDTAREHVGIGDVYVVAGQSNASGAAWNNQTWSHATLFPGIYGNDDQWHVLADPFDAAAGQVDTVSSDGNIVGGSVWPLVATRAMADLGVPVAFVPTSKRGSKISQWQRNVLSPFARTSLYGNMAAKIQAMGGAKAVLFWQGESDAVDNVPGATYRSLLQRFAADVRTDFGLPVVVAQIGDVTNVSPASLDAIRVAQGELWATGDVTPGPSLYDINLTDDGGGDGVHFRSDADLATAATRWWAAMQQGLYGTGDGRGPRLASAVLNAARTELTVRFTDATLPLEPASATGFTVRLGESVLPSRVGARVGTDTYLVRLVNPAPVGPLTLSFGEGRTGTGAVVPVDSTAARLPAEVAVRVVVG